MQNTNDQWPSKGQNADPAPQAHLSRQIDSAGSINSPSEADELLMVCLDRLAVLIEQATPPVDLEAKLMAKAESLHLLPASPQVSSGSELIAKTVPAIAAPHQKTSIGLWPRFAWASLALATLAALVWVSTSWNGADAPTPSQETRVAGGSPVVGNAISNTPGSTSASEVKTKPAPITAVAKPLTASKAAPPPIRAKTPAHMGSSVAETGSSSTTAASTLMAEADEANRQVPDAAATDTEAPPQILYSEFVPVGSIAMIRPEESLQTVRVRIGADEGWRLGLPVAPNARDARITADFLIGEDGRPRAVRLVSASP